MANMLRVGHLWRDKWTALSGPLSPLSLRAVHSSRHKWTTLTYIEFAKASRRVSQLHRQDHNLAGAADRFSLEETE